MNPQAGYQPYQPYSATAYNPNAQVASPDAQNALSQNVNQGQSLLSQTAPVTSQTKTQTGKQPNLFERLLPTIGGVAGGLLGLPLNALDVVSGVGGTALNAGLAGAGSAAGKWLENKLTGQAGGNGVLGAAGAGAIGQGAGEAVGAVGSGLLNMLGGKAASAGADLIQGQAARGLLSDAESKALQEMGVTDLRQVPQIHNIVSGANGVLPNTVKSQLASAGGADISGLDQVANNLAAEHGLFDTNSIKTINHAMNTAINNSIPGDVAAIPTKGAEAVYSYSPGALSNALPENVFKQTQKLEQLASAAYKKGFDPYTHQVTDAKQAGLYNVFRGMAEHMRHASFGGDNAMPLTNEVKQSVIDGLAPLKNINPKAYDSYVQQVGQAQNLQDLRPMQSLIVRAQNAVQGTAGKLGAQAGTSAQDVAKGVGAPLSLALSHPLVAAGSLAMASPAADRAGASLLTKIAPALSSTAQNAVITPGLSGAAGVTAALSPNDIPQATGASIMNGMPPQAPQVTNPLQDTLLQQVLGQDVSAGRSALIDPYLAGNYSTQIGQLSTLLPYAQKAAAAQESAQNLAQLFNEAGGAQGPLGGLLSRLGQTFTGGPASFLGSNLNTATAQTQHALAQAGISPNQVFAPQVTQNKQTAQQALENINSLLSAIGGGAAVPTGPVSQ